MAKNSFELLNGASHSLGWPRVDVSQYFLNGGDMKHQAAGG